VNHRFLSKFARDERAAASGGDREALTWRSLPPSEGCADNAIVRRRDGAGVWGFGPRLSVRAGGAPARLRPLPQTRQGVGERFCKCGKAESRREARGGRVGSRILALALRSVGHWGLGRAGPRSSGEPAGSRD
jgi:hypothetical protein